MTEIKIVGAIADENALEEIENIARIFAYEQRMKDYTRVFQPTYPSKKLPTTNQKVIGEQQKFLQNTTPRSHVKGLC